MKLGISIRVFYNIAMHYRNSDLSINRYFTKFKEDINEAKKHGKEVFYNEVRKKNNCYHARKLQGDVCIKDIFIRYWPEFKEKYADRLQRPGLIESIDRFVGCHDFENGFLYFECPNCNEFYMMGFSCHSRMCPSCGKKYKDQRTIKVSEKCLQVPHRQFVFTVPFQLRDYFRLYRKPLLNALFKSVDDAFNALLKNHAPIAYKKEKRRLGHIDFLHTFGRDMKWHPHIHVLIAERYLNNRGELRKHDYFHFDFLRIAFRNSLFNNVYAYFKAHRPAKEQREMYLLLKELRNKYELGYYVYGRKFSESKSTAKDITDLVNYIARYASHPPISERRITKCGMESRTVTWFFDPHEDDDIEDEELKQGRQYITEDVFEFMSRLVMHVADKGFQQIRYYGFYSNKFKGKVKNGLLFGDEELKRMADDTIWANGLRKAFGYDPLLCKCGSYMSLNPKLSCYGRRQDFG